jgi:hypothetical protein
MIQEYNNEQESNSLISPLSDVFCVFWIFKTVLSNILSKAEMEGKVSTFKKHFC